MTTEDPGDIGLMLSYLITVSGMASIVLLMGASLAQIASGIERLHEYAFWDEHEADFDKPTPPSPEWPSSGKLEFRNVSIRYRDELPKVLDGVSFIIEHGQKIGVIGRTGSGKSTILLAVFRILEIAKDENGEITGQILLDGVDIAKIGLHHLRRAIEIIPQDPFLFEGTIRSNIDPESKFTDSEILSALTRVGLTSSLSQTSQVSPQEIPSSSTPLNSRQRQEDGLLSMKILQSGSNLSLGQRQLLLLSRLLLKPPKLLLLDEATSSIDLKTDQLIQKMIYAMKDTTVVTIAHRLASVEECDRIVEMRDGKVWKDDN